MIVNCGALISLDGSKIFCELVELGIGLKTVVLHSVRLN